MGAEMADRLISDLLSNSQRFDADGRAYHLLQEYFDGFPLETLRPLLRSADSFVQRTAAFITAELGREARILVDDVLPLLISPDRHVAYYAMEILTVCCDDEYSGKFAHVVLMLESGDEVLRGLAMRLVSRADVSQLEAAWHVFVESQSHTHANCLRTLVSGDDVEPREVSEMLKARNALVRRYGAIAAKRLTKIFPDLLHEAASTEDKDIGRFVDPQTNE